MSLRRFFITITCLAGLSFLAACGAGAPASTATPEPTFTASPMPPKVLTICLGQEPASLYPLNNASSAARSVLAAIYDGPIDTNSYEYQPVILQRLPSIENGDAQLFAVEVKAGDEVVDASGKPVTLSRGVKVRPAGCRSGDCAVEYDDTSTLQMDQMQVTFNMIAGLTWSDGEPLTADDSLFAYQVAVETASGGSRYLVDRTRSYEAADETTVQWWGKPGFIDPTYLTNFITPLPRHAWGSIPLDQVPGSEEASRKPIGWGAYMLQEWIPGQAITLEKNPHYFRSGEGLPGYHTLTYRYVADPQAAVSDLLAGKCDILDSSIPLDGETGLLQEMAGQYQLQAIFTPIPVMEELAIGIQPAAYDNGKNPGVDRADLFGDARVRQALAFCLDRQKVVDEVLLGLSSIPNSYLPQSHPLYNPQAPSYSFDVNAGNQLLEEAGWMDDDDDPSTPRRASGIEGVADGTRFEVTLITTSAAQRRQASSILAASLAQCGVKVEVETMDATSLYAPGPEGVLFGRNFDLAEFAMGTTAMEPTCEWFTSSQVPGEANHWVGTNVSGYANLVFDAACRDFQASLPDDENHLEKAAAVQEIFTQDLPVIPLYWRLKTAAARMEVCNFAPDPSASSSLWNIEALYPGTGCTP